MLPMSATKDTSLEDHMSGFVKRMETGQKKDHHVKVSLMIIENILKFHQRTLQRKVSRKSWNYTDRADGLRSKLYLSSSTYMD